jgi:hypothetical protein
MSFRNAIFEVLTAVLLDIKVLWKVTRCRPVNSCYGRFDGAWCFFLQSQIVQETDCLTISLRYFEMAVTLYQVKKTELGRTCGSYGVEERRIQGFSGET